MPRARPGTICTGNSITTPVVRFSFLAPADDWILDAIIGFFDDYSWPERFTACGSVSQDDAATAFSAILASLERSLMQVGAIVAYAGTLPSDPALLACDGSSYLRTDYPDLFAAIGTTWGSVDSTHFTVPDLRTRTLVGAGTTATPTTWNVGDYVGEEYHTLVTAEIPSHSHTDTGHTHLESTAVASIGAAITGVPVPSAIPGVGVTGTGNSILSSTGGDGAHNNTQLSGIVNYAIVAF